MINKLRCIPLFEVPIELDQPEAPDDSIQGLTLLVHNLEYTCADREGNFEFDYDAVSVDSDPHERDLLTPWLGTPRQRYIKSVVEAYIRQTYEK